MKRSKKGRRPVKAREGKKRQKAVKAKKILKAKKKVVGRKSLVVSQLKEKLLGKVDHFFDKISVATMELKAPIKVGDIVHVKGHTTDFVQRIDSMQIEHEDVTKASRGQGVGFKVKEKVRDGDSVYFAADQTLKPAVIQSTMFPAVTPKSAVPAISKPVITPPTPQTPKPENKKKADPYSNTKFLSF